MLRGIGGTVAPDLFRLHLEALSQRGELISVSEGLERLSSGRPFSTPAFSIWFDDGYAGVRRYALPVCDSFGITAAIAICSRFTLRQEMFWRASMSCLNELGAVARLRDRLRPYGYAPTEPLRSWTLSRFRPEIAAEIAAVYAEEVPAHARAAAFRIFDTPEGIAQLSARGWIVSNHTASHYPHLSGADVATTAAQFRECESTCRSLGARDAIWVLPFDGPACADPFEDAAPDAMVVRVQSRVNTPESFSSRRLYRFPVMWQRRGSGFPLEGLS